MSNQSVRRGRQRAPWRTQVGVKELQTKMGGLLIRVVYIRSQRVRLIRQAITSEAAYSAALHKARFLACIASACSSFALLGTTSAAIKAWSLACIANAAAQTHCWAPSHRLSKPGSWHVSPAPAAHTHCLATPHQLSQPSSWHASRTPAAVQLIRTPWHHLIGYLHVSHRCNSNCCETVVLGTCLF